MYHHLRRQPLMEVAAPAFPMLPFHHHHPLPDPAPAHQPAQPLHYGYYDRTADPARRLQSASFLRSSAPRQMQHYPAPQLLPSSYRSSFSMDSSSSSGTGSFAQGSSPLGSPYGADMHQPSGAQQPYQPDAYPQSWPQVAQPPASAQYADPYAASYDLPSAAPSASADSMMQGVKAEDSIEAYAGPGAGLYLAPYSDSLQHASSMPDQQHALPAYAMQPYTAESITQQSLGYGYSGGGTEQHQPHQPHQQQPMSPYMLSAAAQLQYPDEDAMPRYVNPTHVSPTSPYSQLHDLPPQDAGCDPRYTVAPAAAHSPAAFTDSSASASAGGSPAMGSVAPSAPIPVPQRKRARAASFTSAESDEDLPGASGASESSLDAEMDEDEEDAEGDDDDYAPASPRAGRRRQLSTSDVSPATSPGGLSAMGRRLAPPVPVPNLTKKSRGRRVPTVQQVGNQGQQKRMYMCKVPGCGKCFARGEHLKRHVRSIHTNEKRASSLPLPFLACDGC
ncbi:hypothetical protein C2E23DRAFT_69842 [Lenzites betulinus]|nr:hypothetical protein C2E23DRAFT_69842 [Lenzites betulinus]